MYTIDASIYARDVDPTDPDAIVCHTLIERLQQGDVRVIVPTLLLAELAASISRTRRDPIRARIVVDALQVLPFMEFVVVDRPLGQEAAEIAADRAIKGADAIYVAVARQSGSTLVTLDREQRQRAAPIVPVLTPQEVLDELAG